MLLNVDWEERVNWERLRKYRIDRIVEPGNSTETAISP